jgi:phosphate:Na+ symporter
MRDRKLAAQLLRHKEWLNRHQRELADRHLAHLAAGGVGNPEISAVHLDLLANLKRINSCLSYVAYAVLFDSQVSAGNQAENPTKESTTALTWLQPPGPATPGTEQP